MNKPDSQIHKLIARMTCSDRSFAIYRLPWTDIPILVIYPGEFDGHQLKLFNLLKPNDYYRAFNII